MSQYVYIRSERDLYTVGFFRPNGEWEAESDHETKDQAATRVHYLNGGQPQTEESNDMWESYKIFRDSNR